MLSLLQGRVKLDGENIVKHIWEQMTWAVVGGTEVGSSVRMGGKKSKECMVE